MLMELAKTRWQQWSALRDGAALVRNPYDLKTVIRLADQVLELASAEEIERYSEELCRDPQALAAIEARLRVRPDLKLLRQLPEGTLGRAYVSHLSRNGITAASLEPGPVTDDLTYVSAHLYETHDIWHTVTGFKTTVADELGLAAFGAAQLPSPFEYFLISGGLLNAALYEFADRRPRMEAISKGWRMGTRAKPFFGVNWNERWELPLAEVRERLGVRLVRRRLPVGA